MTHEKSASESSDEQAAREKAIPISEIDPDLELRAIRELEDDLGEKLGPGSSLADLL